jgi:hypothetical protein
MLIGCSKDTHMKLQARSIVDDKFWIIERNGEKVGTLRHGNEFILTMDKKNYRYSSLSTVKEKLGIEFNKSIAKVESASEQFEVHGYPCKNKPYNDIYDLKRKLPIYTKQEKSTSFFCAGYYIINFDLGWRPAFCPKLITIAKNEYLGPFKTKLEMKERLRKVS